MRPDIDKQSVSCLDDSSRKYGQDLKIPWMKTYLRKKLLENLGKLIHPKFLSWIHLVLLVARFLWHPKKKDKSYGYILLKWLMNTKQSYHKTLVTPSSYIVLMMINTNRLWYTKKLSIILQINRMKILCVNSNALFPMRVRLTNPVPTTKGVVIMWLFNGKQWRLP